MKAQSTFRALVLGAGLVLVSNLVVACGSDSDTTADDVLVGDTGKDTATVEDATVADTTVEDATVADTTTADTTVEDTTVQDVVADTNVGDVPWKPYTEEFALDDVDWDSLPKLPEGKTFTTRYAAGVAVKTVTPDYAVYLGGFGFCGGAPEMCRMSQGVHDPVEARAVVIMDTATGSAVSFVSVDTVGMLFMDNNIAHILIQNKIKDDFGAYFNGKATFICSSHAHSSGDTAGIWGPLFGAGRDEKYATFMRDQIAAAVAEAWGSLGDINMEWGKSNSPNSDDDKIKHDDEIYLVVGTRPEAETPLFTMTRWSSHPTTYGDDDLVLSADWPGTFRKRMEATIGGTAILLNGPIGSVYPDRPSECELEEEAFPEGDRTEGRGDEPYMKTTCTGYQVADNAAKALTAMRPLGDADIVFNQEYFNFHPENEILMFMAEVGPLPYDWCDVYDPECATHSTVSYVKIGDLTFLSTPGESFPSFSERAKEILKSGGFETPVTLGLSNDWMGYLMIEEQWCDESLSYHMSLSPGPLIEPAYMAKLREMVGVPEATE